MEKEVACAPCFWIAGLPGSGKTTLASAALERLRSLYKVMWWDGDSVRKLLPFQTGYTREERLQVATLISNLALETSSQGIPTVVTTVSLYQEIHQMNFLRFKNFHFIRVEVDFAELQARDKKALYSTGQTEKETKVGFGIQPEWPERTDLLLNNASGHLTECTDKLFQYMQAVFTAKGSHAASVAIESADTRKSSRREGP